MCDFRCHSSPTREGEAGEAGAAAPPTEPLHKNRPSDLIKVRSFYGDSVCEMLGSISQEPDEATLLKPGSRVYRIHELEPAGLYLSEGLQRSKGIKQVT